MGRRQGRLGSVQDRLGNRQGPAALRPGLDAGFRLVEQGGSKRGVRSAL